MGLATLSALAAPATWPERAPSGATFAPVAELQELWQMSAFAYRRRSPLSIPLRLLDLAIAADTYESVLIALGAGIRAAEKQIERGGDEIAEYEVEVIENPLGVALVACQPQITAVVEAAMKLPNHGLDRRGLRACGPRCSGNYSQVEVLWELANYFKHRDQWSHDTWTNPPKQNEQTVKVITAAGLSHGSGCNLRTGADVLGNSAYTDVMKFQEIIRSWSTDVRKHIRTKFGQ